MMTTRVNRSVTCVGGIVALTILLLVVAVPGAADGRAKGNIAQVRAGDRLYLHVTGTLPDEPIKGVYLVEPSGKIALGATYGRVEVSGLSIEEAEAQVRNHLTKFLREPRVSLTWYDPAAQGEPALQDRVAKLEKEVAELRSAIKTLRKR